MGVRKAFRVGFILIWLIACNSAGTNPNAVFIPPTITTIVIQPGSAGQGAAAYGTNPLHLPLNSHVLWMNNDTMAHTATSDTSLWDTGTINPGDSSTEVILSGTGTFKYHCTIHGVASMSGTIIVP
jgi:hypothetical protein